MSISTSIPVGHGGAYTNAAPFVGNGGAWHAVKNAWVGNGASWAQFFQALGPFTASGGGYSGSGSSGTGSGRTITVPWSGTSAVLTIPASGGPTSGSYSYAWTIISGGVSPSFDNAALAQPTLSDTFTVPPADIKTDRVTAQCVITDTVSGESYTLTGVTFSYEYTNNTG